jgi:uncharacterized protein
VPAGQGLTPTERETEAAAPAAPPRLQTLDLIRGVAVLGILTINIAGFAGPMIASTSPNLPVPVGPLDEAAYAFNFLFFEGKMRALFSLLFGAGLVLFWERAEAAGRDGDSLQLRRLGWLLLLGMLHYLLLWWGDILFVYAACGIAALLLRPLGNGVLLVLALLLYYAWHVWGMLDASAAIAAETAVRHHEAGPAQLRLLADWIAPLHSWAAQELSEARLGYFELLRVKLVERPFWQIQMVSGVFSETLPLMLIGMVAYRRGFFDGRLPRRRLADVAFACTFGGLLLTALFLGWAWPRHFPPVAMNAALVWGLAMPHLLAGCGYAGLLVLAAPRLVPTWIGRRLVAAGRMAFSNYVLTSVVMTFAFYGWGLGLYAQVGPLAQWAFVIGGWALMLAWSPPWLRRFRRGPLEWAWRSLVEHRALPNRL